MLNIKYYKDLNHNFLIISNKMNENEQNYQYKMISGNKIRHLLDCKIRFVNDECSFYYEISSRQNLESLFSRKEMGYEEIFYLLESIKEVLDELEDFLLDNRYLLLLPEYIFAEPESKEYFFLYYPCAEETDRETALKTFAEFLVNKVNHEQEDAIELTYNIYEAVQNGNFILPSILKLFQAPVEEIGKSDMAGEVCVEDAKEVDSDIWTEEDLYFKPEEDDIERDERRGRLTAVGILAFLCAAAAAGIFGIGYFFTLSREERLASMAGVTILVILSSVLFLYFILNSVKKKSPIIEKEEKNKTEEQETKYKKTERTQDRKGKEGGQKSLEVYSRQAGRTEENNEYGNTVFLDTSAYKKENKLYGTNKGNKYHIDLTHLPCTIGKMAGNVDVVIKDSTVSRIHARFTKKENRIYVTDMNSTNGTFKNGLRLEPNETVLIEPGDELRFGKMTFCYR